MKLIQILLVAASLAVSAVAQTGSQNSDATAPSTSKQQTSAQTGADSQKKNSAKPNAATKKAGDSSKQPEKLQVIVPATTGGKTTMPASAGKNGYKAATPTPAKTPATTGKSTPATASGSSTAQKTPVTSTTGKMTPATGAAPSKGTSGKTASSSKAGSQAAASQGKQTLPVVPVGPASKQTAGKQTVGKQAASQQPSGKQPAAKQTATQSKATSKNPPVVVKTPAEPKVTIKKPSKAELVAASKISSKISSGGRRDPFISPIRAVTPQAPSGPNCSTGKKCLAINELTVKGTAKDTDGKMMAIVASSNSRAYFLRENDQVFNGTVQKITSDSVVFRESTVDNLGRQITHEIVKRINPS